MLFSPLEQSPISTARQRRGRRELTVGLVAVVAQIKGTAP